MAGKTQPGGSGNNDPGSDPGGSTSDPDDPEGSNNNDPDDPGSGSNNNDPDNPGGGASSMHGLPCTTHDDCDDGDACTDDACEDFTCDIMEMDCDDSDNCTLDLCDPDEGCYNEPKDCHDGDACTADACAKGDGCTYTPLVCDFGACDSDTGCPTEFTCNNNDDCFDADDPCKVSTCGADKKCHDAPCPNTCTHPKIATCDSSGCTCKEVPCTLHLECEDAYSGAVSDCAPAYCHFTDKNHCDVGGTIPCSDQNPCPATCDGKPMECYPVPGLPGYGPSEKKTGICGEKEL